MLMEKLGHKNFTLLGRMMDLNAAKLRTISQNVANINTPNYRRRELKFDKALREAMGRGHASDYRSIRGYVDRPNNTAIRNNGNNVDIDLEMLNMSQTTASYEIYTDLYKRKSQMVKMAIRGGR